MNAKKIITATIAAQAGGGVKITLARAALLEEAGSPIFSRRAGDPAPTSITGWMETLYIIYAPLADAGAAVDAGQVRDRARAWGETLGMDEGLKLLADVLAAGARLDRVAEATSGSGAEDGGKDSGNASAATAGSSPSPPPPPSASAGASSASSTA